MRSKGQVDGWVWVGHIALALGLGPLVSLAEATSLPMAFWYAVLSVYGLAPFVGYGWSMRGRLGSPPDEPCRRTGTLLGWHWFEFAGDGGDRWWTRDAAVARRLRAWRAELPMHGHELNLQPMEGPRPALQLDRMVKNLMATSASMVVGFFACVAWIGLTDAGTRQTLAEVASVAMACAPFALVPALVALWVAYWGAFLGGWSLWHRVVAPRRTASIRWTGPQLHTDQGTAYLDEPGCSVALQHDAFGTALVVHGGKDPLVVRGDHALLAPLADVLQERIAGSAATTPEETQRAKAWAKSVQQRGRER